MLFPFIQKKRCAKCKKEKPLAEFCKNRNTKDGLGIYCKSCYNEIQKQWRKDNPEKAEKILKRYQQRNREEIKLKARKARRENPEKNKEARKKYYYTHHEKAIEAARKYRKEDPERSKEIVQKYQQAHPEKGRQRHRRRRARKLQADGSHDTDDIQFLFAVQKGRCAACGELFTKDDMVSVDHIIPLTKKGSDNVTNLQLLHRSCNSKKHTKIQDFRRKSWKRQLGEYLQEELFE
jgi:5-methylcytosine-specific restriction endonuclease McrA